MTAFARRSLGQCDGVAPVRVAAIEQRHMADGLHQLGSAVVADGVNEARALVAVLCDQLDLDELVIVKRALEFVEYCLAESGIAGAHYRLEVVAEASQIAALRLSQSLHGEQDPCPRAKTL